MPLLHESAITPQLVHPICVSPASDAALLNLQNSQRPIAVGTGGAVAIAH